jgi:hypothetical protein
MVFVSNNACRRHRAAVKEKRDFGTSRWQLGRDATSHFRTGEGVLTAIAAVHSSAIRYACFVLAIPRGALPSIPNPTTDIYFCD